MTKSRKRKDRLFTPFSFLRRGRTELRAPLLAAVRQVSDGVEEEGIETHKRDRRTVMQSITDAIAKVRVGAPATFQNLAVFPLLTDHPTAANYLTLDEGLARQTVRITEVSEGGSVPQLRLTNSGDSRVFLLDGEELVGAKQNRILNLSIMAPAGKTIVIPVSCVEAHRWRHMSAEFASAPRTHYSEGRAKKMAQVSE